MTPEKEAREREMQRLRQAVDAKKEEARAHAEEESLTSRQRPQDEGDVRAKNSGHKKKTADKWNQ
jgi:hypothetical protein